MNKVLLFTTKFCAKCPAIKSKLENAEIPFELIDAIQEPILVKEFQVKSVPSVVMLKDDGNFHSNMGGNPNFDHIREFLSA